MRWHGLMAFAAVIAPSAVSATDDELAQVMSTVLDGTGARGIAVAVVENGRVVEIQTAGQRNERGDPITPDTVMYGASLTKAAFVYMVMQLVDEGKLDLDTSIGHYLPRPLPDYAGEEIERRYARYSDLRGDERWRLLTPRILLSHRSGFANFAFVETDGKLQLHFRPGSRYAYSGDGINLLQFVLETGLSLDVGKEMQRRVFDPQGMTRTSMTWRPDFRSNLADGWTAAGTSEPHDERSRTRAAGSMDTTINDMAKLVAAVSRGDGLSGTAMAEMLRSQAQITTASQFPTLQAEADVSKRIPGLGAALGFVHFSGPQGPGYFKTGHNETTANYWVCLEQTRRCVVILSNDVRAEAGFARIVHSVLGEVGLPWKWEYPDLTMLPEK